MRVKRMHSSCGQYISVLRCSLKSCQIRRSIRLTNKFFTFRQPNGIAKCNLSLCHIVELVYEWLYSRSTISQLIEKTGHASQTIIDWKNLMREVCSLSVNSQTKYNGTLSNPIQIDESSFCGKCKYKRGRLRNGDKNSKQ